MFFNRRCELSKRCLTLITGSTAISCMVIGYALQVINEDSVPMVLIGRNLVMIGVALSGATFAYAGIHMMNCWNESCAPHEFADVEIQTNAEDCANDDLITFTT